MRRPRPWDKQDRASHVFFLSYKCPTGAPGVAYEMESVIILKGAGSRGKTQTLKILIAKLLSEKGAALLYQENYIPDENSDCFVIVEVPSYGRVGVITNGDPGCEGMVERVLEECVKYECKAVIGASRTKESSTHDTIYTILWKFGSQNNAKTVETTTIVSYPNWGRPLNTRDLNAICADNIETILRRI